MKGMYLNNKLIYIYTDGACRGNPGPGGWGALLRCENYKKEIKGSSQLTTNNIMELTAVIESLKLIKNSSKIIITTDSTYVKNGINDWIHNWKLKGCGAYFAYVEHPFDMSAEKICQKLALDKRLKKI